MWAKVDIVECCAQDEPIHHVSLSVGEQIPRSPLFTTGQNISTSFIVQHDCCLNFHGVCKVPTNPCLTRWLYVPPKLQPLWAPSCLFLIYVRFFPICFPSKFAILSAWNAPLSLLQRFIFILQLSAQILPLPGSLPWPLLLKEDVVPWPLPTPCTVLSPFIFFTVFIPI